MSASFWLEAGLTNDDGQGAATSTNNQARRQRSGVAGRQGLTFNRRSTVSLAGGWGELRLGRDYTPQFWNLTVFDPFGTNGVGTTQILNSSRSPANSRRSFALPTSSATSCRVTWAASTASTMHYLGENASGAADSQ